MRILTTLVLASLTFISGYRLSAGQLQREEFRLRATVQGIVPLPSYSGTVMPVGGDPRFALTVRIDSITPAITNFNKGDTVTFAIHSPSRVFGSADPKDNDYDFILSRTISDGKVRYSNLEVRL